MSWLLWVQVTFQMTCAPTFPACPEARPPVVFERTYATEEQCEAGLKAYRRAYPAHRVLSKGPQLTIEQVSQIECRRKLKG